MSDAFETIMNAYLKAKIVVTLIKNCSGYSKVPLFQVTPVFIFLRIFLEILGSN